MTQAQVGRWVEGAHLAVVVRTQAEAGSASMCAGRQWQQLAVLDAIV